MQEYRRKNITRIKKREREYYLANQERYRIIRSEYNKKNKQKIRQRKLQNPEKFLLDKALYRAKERNLEFDISVDDIFIPDKCPVFNFPLSWQGSKDNSPSLDRIDSTKGYVKGNIIVISTKANRLKSDGTLSDFEKIISWLKALSNVTIKQNENT